MVDYVLEEETYFLQVTEEKICMFYFLNVDNYVEMVDFRLKHVNRFSTKCTFETSNLIEKLQIMRVEGK